MRGAIVASAIQWIARCIHDAPQRPGPHTYGRPRAPRLNLVTEADTAYRIGSHRQHRRSSETDDLARIAAPVRVLDLARLAHETEWAVGFNQVAHNLVDAAPPSQCRAGFEIVIVGSENRALHRVPGLNASRSKNPCSTSFNCVSSPKFAAPSCVSRMQSCSLSSTSSITVTRAAVDCAAK